MMRSQWMRAPSTALLVFSAALASPGEREEHPDAKTAAATSGKVKRDNNGFVRSFMTSHGRANDVPSRSHLHLAGLRPLRGDTRKPSVSSMCHPRGDIDARDTHRRASDD